MIHDFLAFNANAFRHLVYLFSSNLWMILLLAAMVGTVVLRLKETVDTSVRDEQNIHGDFGTDLCVELLNENFVADLDLILFTTGLNDCVHALCFLLLPRLAQIR